MRETFTGELRTIEKTLKSLGYHFHKRKRNEIHFKKGKWHCIIRKQNETHTISLHYDISDIVSKHHHTITTSQEVKNEFNKILSTLENPKRTT
ncbi:MAG: hypothetical protein QW270_06905 [Candidatus Bathyarchaeia archaeon]